MKNKCKESLDGHNHKEDAELFLRIAQGDEQAFNEVFYKYHKRFYAAAVKMTHSQPVAEELVQDVFVTLWMKRTELQHMDKPFSYLFTTLYHRIYAHLKKLAREKERISEVVRRMNISEDSTEKLLVAREQEAMVNEMIGQLPEQQRKVYQLIKQQGLSRQEAASELALSPNTVRNHLREASKNLAAGLEKVLLICFLFGHG